MRYSAFVALCAVSCLTSCSDLKEEVTHLKEEASHLREEATHLKEEASHLRAGVTEFGPGPN